MSIDNRLSKLMPALSARERAVLALRAQNAGQDAGEARAGMPPEQRHEYNKYMGLAFVAGCQFGSLVHVIVSQIDNLRFQIERMDLLDRAAGLLEEDNPDYVTTGPVRPWRKVLASRAHADIGVPEFLRSLAMELRGDAFDELAMRWRELCAVEIVTAEIAAHFDGADRCTRTCEQTSLIASRQWRSYTSSWHPGAACRNRATTSWRRRAASSIRALPPWD
jgi:hypothetical protein